MRTTLTLDDDVATKLQSVARRSGRPFRDVLNETLRRGLMSARAEPRRPFRVNARSLGGARPGMSLQNVGALLEQLEGPGHR